MNRDTIIDWLRGVISNDELNGVEGYFDELEKTIADGSEYRAGAEAKIGELNGLVEKLTSDNEGLKARNYDLLMQLPAEQNAGDGAVVEEVQDDGEVIHIDNLFTEEGNENGNETN